MGETIRRRRASGEGENPKHYCLALAQPYFAEISRLTNYDFFIRRPFRK